MLIRWSSRRTQHMIAVWEYALVVSIIRHRQQSWSLFPCTEWMNQSINQDQCFGSVVAKRRKRRRERREGTGRLWRFIQNEWMNRIKHNSKQYIINQSTQIHLQVPVPHPSTLTALSTTIPRSQTFTIRSRQHTLVYGRKAVTENCREPHPIDIAWKQYTYHLHHYS